MDDNYLELCQYFSQITKFNPQAMYSWNQKIYISKCEMGSKLDSSSQTTILEAQRTYTERLKFQTCDYGHTGLCIPPQGM